MFPTSHKPPNRELKDSSSVIDSSKSNTKVLPNSPKDESSSSLCSNCVQLKELVKKLAKNQRKVKHLEQTNSDLWKQIAQLQKQLKLSQDTHERLARTLMHKHNLTLLYDQSSKEEVKYELRIIHHPVYAPQDGLQGAIVTFQPTCQLVPVIVKKELTVVLPVVNAEISNSAMARASVAVKLKATIGQQEEKIRSLTEELVTLRAKLGHEVSPSVDCQETNEEEEDLNNNKES